MAYRIISRTKSFLARSITFEVDGDIKTISAPPQNATFDDLIQQIESKYGDGKKVAAKPVQKAEETKDETPETAPEKEKKQATATPATRSRKKKSE